MLKILLKEDFLLQGRAHQKVYVSVGVINCTQGNGIGNKKSLLLHLLTHKPLQTDYIFSTPGGILSHLLLGI